MMAPRTSKHFLLLLIVSKLHIHAVSAFQQLLKTPVAYIAQKPHLHFFQGHQSELTSTCCHHHRRTQVLPDATANTDCRKREEAMNAHPRSTAPRQMASDRPFATVTPSTVLAITAAAATSSIVNDPSITSPVPPAHAATTMNLQSFSSNLTPENFQPVCGTSDGLYRLLQDTTASIVGPDNFSEYKPLIAGGLLRIRLELCVLESFFNEAVVPFVRDNGLSWVLPLHETVETFLAGAIFALASTFILIGSTKILTVLVTYTDFLIGLPSRLLGGFAFDRAQGKPVTLDIGIGPFQTRLIGPPKEEDGEAKIDLRTTSPVGIVILLLSGFVNYFGKALGVSSTCAPFKHTLSNGLFCSMCFTIVSNPFSLYEKSLKQWMGLLAVTSPFGPVYI